LTEPKAMPVGEIQRRAIAGSMWTVFHVVVYLPIAFLANALVARSLGVESYGYLAFLSVAMGFSLVFANFGFTTAFIQRGGRAEAGGRSGESVDLLRRSLGFHIIVELPILVTVALVLTRADPWWEVAALVAAVVFTCVLSGAALSIVIENRTAAAAQLAIGVNLIVQGATVMVAVSTRSASAVFVVRLFVGAICLGFGFMLLDGDKRWAAISPRLPRGLSREFWRFALFSWAASLVTLLVFQRTEIFVLKAFGQAEALGVYAVAFGLAQQLTAPVDALLFPLLPAVAGILSEWPEHSRATFERSTRVSALMCGGVAAVVLPLLVFSIPLFYGRGFGQVSWVLVPLALASIFQSVNNPVIAFVNARERGGLRLKVTSVALLVDLVIAVALIPELGVWGATTAAVAGQALAMGWLAASEPLTRDRGFVGVSQLYRSLLVGVGVSGAALVVGAVVQSRSVILAPLIACGLGGALYAIAVKLSRSGLVAEDSNALVSSVSPRLRVGISWVLRPFTLPDQSC